MMDVASIMILPHLKRVATLPCENRHSFADGITEPHLIWLASFTFVVLGVETWRHRNMFLSLAVCQMYNQKGLHAQIFN